MHPTETRPNGGSDMPEVLPVSTVVTRPSMPCGLPLQAHQRRVRPRLRLHRTVLRPKRHVQLGAHGQSTRVAPSDRQIRHTSRAPQDQLGFSHPSLSASRTTTSRAILRPRSSSMDDGVVYRGQLFRTQALLHRYQQHTQWLRPSIVV